MYTKDQICEKVRSLYPDVGECGSDISLSYDRENNAWMADLKQGHRHLKTYVDSEDANACMEGNQCIGLGLQIHQLKDNIKNMHYT